MKIGGGPVGPALNEIVKTLNSDALGEIVSIDWHEGTFRIVFDKYALKPGMQVTSMDVPIAHYGDLVVCAFDCGHESHSVRCFLRKEHPGPCLYKLGHE